MFVVETTAQATASARLFYGRSPAVQGCADEAALRTAIAQRAGHDPISPMASNSVAVSITREGDQLVADVKLTNPEGLFVGARTLRGSASQCAELTDTIALTIAIALDTNDELTPSDSAGPRGRIHDAARGGDRFTGARGRAAVWRAAHDRAR